MNAKHLIPLAITALLHSTALWANGTDIFQGWQAPPAQPQLAPVPPAVISQAQAVQVHTLPDGRYHAEINYQDKADETHKFTFEGTPDEIRQQVQQNTLLPEDRKQALLQALDMKPDALFNQPLFGGKNPFDQPFFKGNPFDDPFFKNNLLNDDFFKDFFKGMPDLGQFIQPPPATPPTAIPPAPQTPPAGNKPGERIRL